MARPNLNDLLAFVAVARSRSFTRAAAQLGVSQSALSHTMRGLETRMGMRLLTRTTRSVSVTDAGERLLLSVGSRLDEIEEELDALTALRDKPAGTVRITTGEHALTTILWPTLRPFLRKHPDIQVEFDVSYALKDIVAERLDAGVRMGEQIEKDMIAVRIGPPMRMATVGSPAYFKGETKPKKPQDLTRHRCINLRLPTYGGFYPWEFARQGREMHVRVQGQLAFSTVPHIVAAAIDGFGLAFVPEDMVLSHIKAGRLVRVLEDWCPAFPGYHLYYPSRRQHSPAFSLVLEALRYR
ncbi:DNA-binding transcriptional regulator, LysR family [Dyella jiangningensis]|uniref:LysR family transcriptional regulator n=1 Tax=Dyella sp. AtDHG13 TaxID=1938897 RepID=UPI0008847352|nr:LysR family transcriptional regulator [Dyella sp. AtDHG13]PXV56894.1 DNA-binding transcriptional LysR family regulator [Dyella sp. AtDHG13]SDK60071.1 DNA-binding transcriptional regulator, LysR family [Dyella jiangningensis]